MAYIGSDISLSALTWSRQNLYADLRVNVADVHHLPYADNAFPLVMCLEVLEHIPDSAIGLRELARVSSDYIIVHIICSIRVLSRRGRIPEEVRTLAT